ncbi:MAG: hypothetical protein AB7U29_18720 [Desulfobulbus sp.]
MIGVAYLLFFGVYLLVSLAVVAWVAIRAKRRGRSPLLWGIGAVLVMYNLVFWDWLPSRVQHDYYCRNHAGFWVYKTLDQWKQENPGVFETLIYDNGRTKSIHEKSCREETHHYILNERFKWVVQYNSLDLLGVDFDLGSAQELLVDRKTGEVLAKYVGFSVGSGVGGLRFWKMRRCSNDSNNQHDFSEFEKAFKGRKP